MHSLNLKKAQAFCLAVLMPATFLMASSSASAAGVNDISSAMRYTDVNTVIGSEVAEISNSDDSSVLIQAPWPMNFFGKKFTGLCLTSNGTISPVVFEDTPDCNDSYDNTMSELADDAGAPLIAAFANDNDTGNTILDWEEKITRFQHNAGSSTVTVTTDTNHGRAVGDIRSVFVVIPGWENGNLIGSRADEYWFEDVVITAVTANTFSFSSNLAMDYSGDTYTPLFTSQSLMTITTGFVWDQESLDIDGESDGVGKPGTIYAGTATVDGRDAWVYTNYRSVTFEDNNPQILTNTFQIVLVKRATANGDTAGFDFDIEYNYGAMMDGGDGYTVLDGDCEEQNADCRTGVGIVDFEPIFRQADVYELFASTPSRDLMDWFVSGMTNNRLNSDVNGRYTFPMVGGVIQNFNVPVMDGTGATVARPATPGPLDPVPTSAGLTLGSSSLMEDGEEVEVSLVRNPAGNGMIFSTEDFEVELAGFAANGTALALDTEGNLVLNTNGEAGLSGSGFAPESPVKVYAFSSPIFMGTVFNDDTGSFSSKLPIPPELTPGVHNIQLVGFDADNDVRVLTVGVRIVAPAASAAPAAPAAPAASVVLARTGFDGSPLLLLAGILIAIGLVRLASRKLVTSVSFKK